MTTLADVETVLTVDQAAEHLGVKPSTVREWLRDGKLLGIKPGGRVWRVRAGDLARFITDAA